MIDSIGVAQTGPEIPSPWWLKGGAIFIGVLGLASLLNAVTLVLGGVMMDTMMEDINTEEMCAENPESDEIEREECEAFIESISEMSEMSLWDVGAAFAALLFLLSIPTTIIMWNAEDRDTALKLAGVWISIHAIAQFHFVHSLVSWTDDFYESIPLDEMAWVSLFTSIASYAGVLMCELTMAAGLVLISYKTRPPTALEMPSAFHISDE